MTIGEFVATGCGQSKKKAKHCAAKAILEKLRGAQAAGLTAPGQPTIPDLAQARYTSYPEKCFHSMASPIFFLPDLLMLEQFRPSRITLIPFGICTYKYSW